MQHSKKILNISGIIASNSNNQWNPKPQLLELGGNIHGWIPKKVNFYKIKLLKFKMLNIDQKYF